MRTKHGDYPSWGQWRTLGSICVACCLAVCGCGPRDPKLCVVSGTASFDGQPISRAEIIFEPKSGQFAAGAAIIVNGEFKALRVAPGESYVRISGALKSEPLPQTQPARREESPGIPLDVPMKVTRIPPRYNDETILTADVKKSGDRFDFKLESAPVKKR
jgi:hypothetical protein